MLMTFVAEPLHNRLMPARGGVRFAPHAAHFLNEHIVSTLEAG